MNIEILHNFRYQDDKSGDFFGFLYICKNCDRKISMKPAPIDTVEMVLSNHLMECEKYQEYV